ncbi:uncharacterized protein LOC126908654 [Daktulosphaira vitifoliae]|uniref:uncharacterized protein LOC126908654 n=1 Tax=Daktulosphaira vitifoliae TaxID=58002 RepID=UPI0021AAF6C7|nr:uncharacterized protein LOC126908654 [Daktulosphaira vitifoliae]
MSRIAAKFVPRLLTDEQKQNRKTISQELFERAETDLDFLKNIITGDETWIYGYDIETSQSSQWKSTNSPRPKSKADYMKMLEKKSQKTGKMVLRCCITITPRLTAHCSFASS